MGNDVELDIEQHLRGLVGSGSPLPTVHALARAFRTATRRVARVVGRLRDEGLIAVSRGRHMHHAARTPVAINPPPATRTQFICQRIRETIEDGRYPVGTRLPKAHFFAVEEQVCDNTVRRALRTLERQHLVHHVSQGYAAGPARPRAPRKPPAARVLLLLQVAEEWWTETSRNSWLMPFNAAFMREVELAGVQTVPVLLDTPSSRFLVHGQESIDRFIRSLGERAMGILVLGHAWDYWYRIGRKLSDVARWSVGFGKPVVWFDHVDRFMDEEGRFHPADYAAMSSDRSLMRWFTRCHFAHDAGVRVALDALYGFGHRRIGIPWHARDGKDLADVRIGALTRLAPEYPGLTLVPAVGTNRAAPEVAARHLRRLPAQGRRLLGSRVRGRTDPERARLQGLAEVMLPLLVDQGVTAVIVLSDAHAGDYYIWLRTMGYEVPRDVSLVSFDANAAQLYPWQISSVNFGFDYLGYSAYHLIARDIPVPRQGIELPARCRLNHPGSVDTAPRVR